MATAGESGIRKSRERTSCYRWRGRRANALGLRRLPRGHIVALRRAPDGTSTVPSPPSSSSTPSSVTAVIPNLKNQRLCLCTTQRSIHTLRMINCLTQEELRFRIERLIVRGPNMTGDLCTWSSLRPELGHMGAAIGTGLVSQMTQIIGVLSLTSGLT